MAENKDEKNKEKKPHDRVSMLLYFLYLIALAIGLLILYKIVDIQINFKPSDRVLPEISNRVKKVKIEPERGQILANDGRVLAMSYTTYTLAMDCTVGYKQNLADKKDGETNEQKWRDKALALSEGLSANFPKTSAEQFFRTIIHNRTNNRRYWVIADNLDNSTIEKLKELPLFNESSNSGGMIVEKHNSRRYPYGELGRRVIGKVNNNAETEAKSRYGIEGRYESRLHGTDGYEWMRMADGRLLVHNYDSTYRQPIDGQDIRTTIDIDIQDMLDKAIRSQIRNADHVDKICGVVLDVKTGAIRAMVNLTRYSSENIREDYNYCIGTSGEPGSVFKLVGLSGLIEDGFVQSTDETLTTDGGRYLQKYGKGKVYDWGKDRYITNWEEREKARRISIKDALKISSNVIFRRLINENYKSDPQKYIDKIYAAKLGEAFDFDISGLANPRVKNYTDPYGKRNQYWSPIDLPTMAIGYGLEVTPLHIANFYNCIANGGRMMRPYLVEDLEIRGKVIEQKGPEVLNASVFSKKTADILSETLIAVTSEEHGTAYNAFKDCPVKVSGKTGTSRKTLPRSLQGKDPYHTSDERFMHQGTFVGFFPSENPQYTILISGWSKLSKQNLYGGGIPALAAREVVDGLYLKDRYWREIVREEGTLPPARPEETGDAVETIKGVIPDLKGKTLSEAMWIIENSGYKCSFSGVGHVSAQSPKPGTMAGAGTVVTIELK